MRCYRKYKLSGAAGKFWSKSLVQHTGRKQAPALDKSTSLIWAHWSRGLGPSEELPELSVVRLAHSGSVSMSWLLSLSVGTHRHGVLVFVNLFSWFEFTKEWLIQNCLWQKYTLLWLYSSGSNIVMGLLKGRKPIWVLNDHDSVFYKLRLLPFVLLTLYPLHC